MNRKELYFPSVGGWATPRTREVRLTTDNCELILPKKIDKINNIKLHLINDDIRFYIQYGANQTSYVNRIAVGTTQNRVYDLDITPFFVDIDYWKTLPIVDTSSDGNITSFRNAKNNTFYYERNSTTIELRQEQYRSGSFLAKLVFDVMLQYALYNFISQQTETVYGWDGAHWLAITGVRQAPTTKKNVDIPAYEFRVRYEPSGESVKVETSKTTPQATDFLIPFSQTQPIISAQQFGRNAQATTNRTGVPTRTICRKVKYLADVRKIGAVWQETDQNGNKTGAVWRLTNNDLTVQGGWAYCTETWAKGWSMQSEYVGINREFRSWNIPADILQRNVIYQDYCLITSNNSFVENNVALQVEAKKEILRSINRTAIAEGTEGNLLFIFKNQQNYGAVTSLSSLAIGNALVFNARTKDNLSVGYQRLPSSETTDNDNYCKEVYYCNEDGTMSTARFVIADSYEHEDTSLFPEVRESTVPANKVNTPSNVMADLTLLVDKDPAEQINFTYQMNLCTYDPMLVIGSGWANNCPLVAQRPESGIQLQYWELTKDVPQGAQTMTTGYGTKVTRAGDPLGCDFTEMSFTAPARFCVTDMDNNILLAYNGNTAKKFYLKFTHDSGSLYRDYLTTYGAVYKDAV